MCVLGICAIGIQLLGICVIGIHYLDIQLPFHLEMAMVENLWEHGLQSLQSLFL